MIEKFRILLKSTGDEEVATVKKGYPSMRTSRRSGDLSALLLALCSPPDSLGALITRSFVANIKSQIKRNKQNVVDRERNKAVKSELRTRTKNAVAAVGTENEETALRAAIKRIDKAAAKGVIHKNQAANKKSGLMRRIASLRTNA
jgi:small subunit ribosomal protein S20